MHRKTIVGLTAVVVALHFVALGVVAWEGGWLAHELWDWYSATPSHTLIPTPSPTPSHTLIPTPSPCLGWSPVFALYVPHVERIERNRGHL